ncbi:MAG: thiol-activated cytolysin family protein [Saprospiraceae bacterium]|nr:thiol-activated cytolysin family protein [Saprospiraceae bacterium]
MKSSILNYLTFSVLLILSIGCRKGESTIEELQKGAVNEIIAGGEVFTTPEPTYEETPAGYSEESTSDNTDFLCNGKRIKETVVLDKLTLNAFDDRSATNTAALYPGSIIKIKDYMEQRDLNGIGNFPRKPVEVSSDLGDLREVLDPGQRGNVDRALKEIEEQNPTFAAKVISESVEAYSIDQAMVHVGVDYKYLSQSVKGRFDVSSTVESHSFAVKFYQIYHTASVSNPVNPSDLFDPSVSIDRIQQLIDDVGPLGYVTEVAYGRMLIGIFTYTGSEFTTSSEVKAKFRSGLAQVNGQINADTRSFFKNSTFKVAILGGDAQQATKVTGSGLGMDAIQAAYRWMEDGGNDPSLGVPIQYKIRQLADPSYPLLAIGGVVEYEVLNCSTLPNHAVIDKIDITAFPAFNEDSDNKPWDELAIGGAKYPDIFLDIQKFENGKWQIGPGYEELKCQDCTSDQLPFSVKTDYPITEEDLSSSFLVQFVDVDAFDQYQTMGEVRFSLRSFLRSKNNPEPENPYPTVATFNNGPYTVKIHISWSTI